VISPTQKNLPDNIQHPRQTDFHASGGIKTRSLRKPRLRPLDHCGRRSRGLAPSNINLGCRRKLTVSFIHDPWKVGTRNRPDTSPVIVPRITSCPKGLASAAKWGDLISKIGESTVYRHCFCISYQYPQPYIRKLPGITTPLSPQSIQIYCTVKPAQNRAVRDRNLLRFMQFSFYRGTWSMDSRVPKSLGLYKVLR
jgi:hypothetical protein